MMDARSQTADAAAFESTGLHYYVPGSDGSGNYVNPRRMDWTEALGEIKRRTGWVLARDEEPTDPRQLKLVPDDVA
ncbi:MAG: hypothetical protein Q8N53_12990, partial [Longimicrobiales bacterium]|nr:hypothetical protein [Longimicrobiales bacterium]